MNLKNLLKNLAQKVKALEYKLGLIADYVVEKGTSGIWTYEKWESGKAECWGRNTSTISNIQTWGSQLYSGLVGRPDYPFAFMEAPVETVSVVFSVNALWLYKQSGSENNNSTTKSVQYYSLKVNNYDANSVVVVAYDVIGKWK